MALAFLPTRNPNPLGFPGGVRPGFDPTHPASSGNMFSCTSMGANYRNTSGVLGTVSGSLTTTLNNAIGPVTVNGGTSAKSSFSGITKQSQSVFTMAAIFYGTAIGTGTGHTVGASSATSNGGWLMHIPGGSSTLQAFNGGFIDSTISLSNNIPYFCVFSTAGSGSNRFIFLVLNLFTGRIIIGQVLGTTGSASDGTAIVGSDPFGGQSWAGGIAAFMFSNTYLSVEPLRLWASDPWSFWYPRRDTMLVGAASAAAFKAYWAQQNNMPVIGAGTY